MAGIHTIQSKIESGKYFKIVNIEEIINCKLFRNITLGVDPKLFTYNQIKKFFLKNNKVKFISDNLIDNIKKQRDKKTYNFYSLKKNIVGENTSSKLTKISKFLLKNNSDYIFVSAPENVAWILNIRGSDIPNTPMPNCRLIISKTKKIFLISKIEKCKTLLKEKIITLKQFFDINEFSKKIFSLKGESFIIDDKTCSIFYENIIKSKFKIKKIGDPTYILKSIKNKTEINNMKKHIYQMVLL